MNFACLNKNFFISVQITVELFLINLYHLFTDKKIIFAVKTVKTVKMQMVLKTCQEVFLMHQI